ncbi:MAG: restriction endonuclease subunit S [Sulfurimonas sp.]
MNSRVSIKKLLEGVEVEWKSLWEVTIWDKKFNAVEKFKQPKIIKYHYLLSKEIKSLVTEGGNVKLLTTNLSNLYTTEELAGDIISQGEIVAIPWGGNPIVQYYNGKFLTSDNRIATSNDTKSLNNKYLYYYLLNNLDLISSFYRGSGIKHPSMADVLDIKIPIPSLKIQSEIVRVLDNFTELTTELTTELSAREKQYSYYRDKLLSFEDVDVEWKKLGEVAEYSKERVSHEKLNSLNYVGVDNLLQNREGKTVSTKVPMKGNFTKYISNDILIGNIRPYLKKIWYADCDGGTNGDVLVIHVTNNTILPRYLYQVLADDNFFIYNMSHAKGAKMPRGNKARILDYLIPIPPLKKQKEIVAILDKFDTITNSISEGLPKEIALRQKQYEYYRDRLLSFEKLKEVE